MAGVSPTGFEPKTTEEIIEDVVTRANSEEYWGEEMPTSPDTGFGIHTGVMAGSFSDLWGLGQAVAAQQNRDTATGIHLDYLAGLIGLSRLKATGSTGSLLFSGRQGAVVPAFFPVADTAKRNVLTQNDLTLNRAGCYNSTFGVAILLPSEDYVLVVEGNTYIYTSSATPTEAEVVNGLANLIGVQPNYSATADEETVTVTHNSFNNILSTTNSGNLDLLSVGGLVTGEAAEVGELNFPANTIIKLVGSNVNIDSVTNPLAFVEGRYQETDEELRLRMAAREQSTGTATKPAIETTIAQVPGVTGVLLIENETMVTNSDGIPPKAFEITVSGGSEDQIADAIWVTKPAGISTHGDITKIVVDHNGDEQAVKFSRKTEKYAWMRVTYTLNDEEIFPSEGEDAMRESVVNEGNSMYSGEDYEPTKFYGPLYTTMGIKVETIEIAVTDQPTDTPVYQTTTIPVAKVENLNFDTVRVELTTV